MVKNKLKKTICAMAFMGIVGLNAYTVSAEVAHSYSFTIGAASQTANTEDYKKSDANPMVIHCSSSTVANGYFTAHAQRYVDNDWYTMQTKTVYCDNNVYGFSASSGNGKQVRFKLEKAMSSTSIFKGKWGVTDSVNVY